MEDPVQRAEQAREGSPYLTSSQTAHFLGVSIYHLVKLRRRGMGPVYRRHCRRVQYHIDDLLAWSAAQATGPTS